MVVKWVHNVEMVKWVHNVDGELRCLICGKAATVGHLDSSEHVKRIEEDALGTIMCGDGLTTRRFNGDKCVGVATKRCFTTFVGMPWRISLESQWGFTCKRVLFGMESIRSFQRTRGMNLVG